jgi:NADH:ubiquinone oxidoreductase subunit 2 (subunit N)
MLAGVFLYVGLRNFFVTRPRVEAPRSAPSFKSKGLPRAMARAIALLEIAAALVLVVPLHLWTPNVLQGVAAGALALLMVLASVYHARRQEYSEPVLALFLLALFVVVGHL